MIDTLFSANDDDKRMPHGCRRLKKERRQRHRSPSRPSVLSKPLPSFFFPPFHPNSNITMALSFIGSAVLPDVLSAYITDIPVQETDLSYFPF
jgi:hypothetical protein